jgi:hypothetical protein
MEQKSVNPIDQELDRLEAEIRRLKVEYDIYFNGGSLRPPVDTKGRVETTIKRLYDSRGMSFGQRFRYNSLVARYNIMRELWRKQEQDREEIGRIPTAEAHAAARSHLVIVRVRDPRLERDKTQELYDHLVAAKRECGERIGGLSFEVFSQFLESRADQIKRQFSSTAIDFIIGVDCGRVKFAARPARE